MINYFILWIYRILEGFCCIDQSNRSKNADINRVRQSEKCISCYKCRLCVIWRQSLHDGEERCHVAKSTMKETNIIYRLQNSESDDDEFVDFSTRVCQDDDFTLADFKTITRRFGYRYYFLAVDPEFGLIKAAIESDHEILPSNNGVIEAWLFKDERQKNNKIFRDKLNSLKLLSKKTPSWKRLLDLIEDFESTHQRKNQRFTELELSTSGLNHPERATKQNETREYLETSFFTAEPVEIVRGNYSTRSSRSRKLYPMSSSPITNPSYYGNIEFSPEELSGNVSSAPEFWTIRSEITQKMFRDGDFPSDIERSNKSTSKSYGSFSKSESPSFGTESRTNGQRSPLNYPNPEVLLQRDEVQKRTTSSNKPYIKKITDQSQKHEDAILSSVRNVLDLSTGACKHRSTDDQKRTHDLQQDSPAKTCVEVSQHDSSAGSYVELPPPSGQSTSKEESNSKTDLIKSDMKYFNTSNQNNFGDEPVDEIPHNNTKESNGSTENKFLVTSGERSKDTHKKSKFRRPLQYVYEPEVRHNNVSSDACPVKPPRTFEYVNQSTKLKQQNPFRDAGTHSIQIGNLTTIPRSSYFERDGLAKLRKGKNYEDICKVLNNNPTVTRACHTKINERPFNDRNGVTLPDVCLSLFDVSKMSREKFHSGRSTNSKATPKKSSIQDNYRHHICLRHHSVSEIKNLSTPGRIPSSCLSLCNFNMNRSTSSVCGSSRHFVNSERKGHDGEPLIYVKPEAAISEQIENLTSDCEVCKLNDKNADDAIPESVLSLYDFKMADMEFGGKNTSGRNLHKDSMACCRSQ